MHSPLPVHSTPLLPSIHVCNVRWHVLPKNSDGHSQYPTCSLVQALFTYLRREIYLHVPTPLQWSTGNGRVALVSREPSHLTILFDSSHLSPKRSWPIQTQRPVDVSHRPIVGLNGFGSLHSNPSAFFGHALTSISQALPVNPALHVHFNRSCTIPATRKDSRVHWPRPLPLQTRPAEFWGHWLLLLQSAPSNGFTHEHAPVARSHTPLPLHCT